MNVCTPRHGNKYKSDPTGKSKRTFDTVYRKWQTTTVREYIFLWIPIGKKVHQDLYTSHVKGETK